MSAVQKEEKLYRLVEPVLPRALFFEEEKFPDMDQAFEGQTKKKKGLSKEETEALMKAAAMEALPTKGKPEQFFKHQGIDHEPNTEQILFVAKYYPQSLRGPHKILDLLAQSARCIAQDEKITKRQEHLFEEYGPP